MTREGFFVIDRVLSRWFRGPLRSGQRGPQATLIERVTQRSGAPFSSGVSARARVREKLVGVPTRDAAATTVVDRAFGVGASGLRGSAGDSWQERGGEIFEAGVAEADGNRTRRGRVATSSYGFEVRGPHQRDNRFRGRV